MERESASLYMRSYAEIMGSLMAKTSFISVLYFFFTEFVACSSGKWFHLSIGLATPDDFVNLTFILISLPHTHVCPFLDGFLSCKVTPYVIHPRVKTVFIRVLLNL